MIEPDEPDVAPEPVEFPPPSLPPDLTPEQAAVIAEVKPWNELDPSPGDPGDQFYPARTRREEGAGGAASDPDHPLKAVDASAGGVPAVRILFGYVAGRKADADMDPTDAAPYVVSLASAEGLQYVWAEVERDYNGTTGIWTATGCSIEHGTSLPNPDAGTQIVPIARITVIRANPGYGVGTILQDALGHQWAARTGNGTSYVDANGT